MYEVSRIECVPGVGHRRAGLRMPAGAPRVTYVSLLVAGLARSSLVDGRSPSASPLVPGRPGEAEQQEALAKAIAMWMIHKGAVIPIPSYVCRVDSVSEACPTIAAALGKHELDLAVPPDARWLFVGPSYMNEIFSTIIAANGGFACKGPEQERAAGEKAMRARPSAEEVAAPLPIDQQHQQHLLVKDVFQQHSICQHSNGAKLAFTDDAHDRAAFALEEWDHGVYMQPHNKAEYDAEHARAVSEGRAVNASNFLDSEGRDMCLPRDSAGDVAPETTLSSYQACMDRRDELRAFDASLGGAKKRLTVFPWQVVPPAQPTVPGTYFARERAQTIDCYTVPHMLGVTPDGFSDFSVSSGKQHNLGQHQCVSVCEYAGTAMSVCDPGSIAWIAHDVLALLRSAR